MNELRVMIVDDEQPARNRLRELLDDCRAGFPHRIVGESANGIEALEKIAADAAADAGVDVVLVDIHMPGMSGIEFARHLQVLQTPPAVIFITAHDQYAVQAFEVNAIDYLLKPVRASRLLAALKKAGTGVRVERGVLDRIDSQPRRYFSVAERGRVTLVPVSEVIYLRAEQKYVTLHARDRDYLVEESLTRLEQEFGERLVRIHRNCLVARSAIRGFERGAESEVEAGWAVVLEGRSERLPVSRRLWPQVKTFAKNLF
jgi:two-component system response regulator AlgR